MIKNFIKNSVFALLLLGSNAGLAANCYDEQCPAIFDKVIEDKHYIKPGTVVATSEGLFLCAEGILIPISAVEADEEGVYLRTEAFKFGKCPICGWPLIKRVCLNPKCPTYN